MATIPLTLRGAEQLKAELHRLKTVERHAAIQAIRVTQEISGAKTINALGFCVGGGAAICSARLLI